MTTRLFISCPRPAVVESRLGLSLLKLQAYVQLSWIGRLFAASSFKDTLKKLDDALFHCLQEINIVLHIQGQDREADHFDELVSDVRNLPVVFTEGNARVLEVLKRIEATHSEVRTVWSPVLERLTVVCLH